MISEAVLKRIQILAKQLDLSEDALLELALERFSNHEDMREIQQGEVYWLMLESEIPHPHVVIQDDIINYSRIQTVVVCALTTNLKRANGAGNILLDIDEANLPKQSIIEVSKVSTIAKAQLGEYIGKLSEQRIKQIFAGMQFLQRSYFSR